MRIFNPILTLSLALVLLASTGCERNDIQRAQILIADYNYAKAKTVLEEISESESPNPLKHRLLMQTYFVLGENERGYSTLDSLLDIDPDNRFELAEHLFKATAAIIREKDRFREVIELFDRCLTLDPALREKILELLWDRSIEYLENSGETGYRLMKYATGIDEEIIKKLRAKNRRLARAYEEMALAESVMNNLGIEIVKFRQATYRLPESLDEIKQKGLPASVKTELPGWYIIYTKKSSQRFQLRIEAKKDNKYNIPLGMYLDFMREESKPEKT